MPAIDVSVVIPTRNRAAMLKRTIGGAVRQRDVELEVLVVDDSTNDKTEAMVKALGDARVRHVPGRARGVSDARNLGTAQANGEWIAYLDDDDLWAPGKLRAQIDLATTRNATFAWSGAVPVDPDLTPLAAKVPPPDTDDLRKRLVTGNAVPAGCSNVIARTEAVASIGGFDERLAQVADWDMWLQLATTGPAAATPDVHVAYVQHDENMLLTDTRDPFAEFELLKAKHSSLATELHTEFSRPHYARWVATRYRRAGHRMAAARTLTADWRHPRHGAGNLVRAVGVLLGEGAVKRARGGQRAVAARPEWLDAYAG